MWIRKGKCNRYARTKKKMKKRLTKQKKKCARDATNTISISGKYVYFYFHNASAAHVSF